MSPSGLDHDTYKKVKEQIASFGYEIAVEISNSCDFLLYCVNPAMNGVKDIIDVVDNANHYPSKTKFCALAEPINGKEYNSHQVKSLVAVGKMVKRNGAEWFENLDGLFEDLRKNIVVT